MVWLFRFITYITFKWDYVLWCTISLMVWIGLCDKLRIHRVHPDPVRWSCKGFGYLWQAFMISWMIWYKNYLEASPGSNSMLPQV